MIQRAVRGKELSKLSCPLLWGFLEGEDNWIPFDELDEMGKGLKVANNFWWLKFDLFVMVQMLSQNLSMGFMDTQSGKSAALPRKDYI